MSTTGARQRAAKAIAPERKSTAVDLSLESFVPYRLVVLARDVSRALASVYSKRFGLSIAEWRILAALAHFGSMPAGLVAERSSLDKPKVTRAVQRLAARKLVTRRTIAADRRAVEIALTPKGREIFEAAASLAIAWERDMLAALDAGDQSALGRILDLLDARVKSLAIGRA